MQKTIYKYPLEYTVLQPVKLPKGSEILTVQSQFEKPNLWALVNPNETELEERFIEIFGTGHSVPCDMGVERKYIATYQESDGNYIFHAFERLN